MPIDFSKAAFADVAALNRFSLCNVQPGLFPTGNRRATVSTPQQTRSESSIAINPRNPRNMVGASKKFTNPDAYLFKIGVVYTFDGGQTWGEAALPVDPAWDCLTDPWVAFDSFGNAFLIAEPDKLVPAKQGTSSSLDAVGMYAYRSQDGGPTWEAPRPLDLDAVDDKQCVVCDNNRHSPFYGNVYVVWGANAPPKFARSSDHGVTWKGPGNGPPGVIPGIATSFAPELAVSADGTVHVLWHYPGNAEIWYVRSTDGGASFSPPRAVVDGMVSLTGHLPSNYYGDFPHFPDARFRVLTLVNDCVASGHILVVTWADMREGHSRIYYRRSLDSGLTWEGPLAGQSLLPNVSYGEYQCFHPQIAATGTGVIGCAFYVYGPEPGGRRIRVQLAGSWDDGATFDDFITVTDRPWDPLINAPHSHGDPNLDFIGEYFGLDAGEEDFALLWTDTRTGVQELFFDRVATKRVTCPHVPELVGTVLGGSLADGTLLIIVGGHLKIVPPRGPLVEAVNALVAYEEGGHAPAERQEELRRAARQAVQRLLESGGGHQAG
jgi:hypothetical protein